MIFISTSCLNERSVKKVLKTYMEAGIKNIELGSSHKYEPEILEFLNGCRRKHSLNFIIHSYFPPPKKDFVINLASQNPEIIKKSLEHAKRTISLCDKIDSKIYSIHGGTRIDPSPEELEKGLKMRNPSTYEQSFETFVKSIKELCDYASQFKVNIAVENHGVPRNNLLGGKNELLILSEAKEFSKLIMQGDKKNLGILVDLGHLMLSSNTLNFNKDDFIDYLKEYVQVFHVHTNEGYSDQHEPIEKGDWALRILKQNKHIPIVIESKHPDIKSILKTKKLIEEGIR